MRKLEVEITLIELLRVSAKLRWNLADILSSSKPFHLKNCFLFSLRDIRLEINDDFQSVDNVDFSLNCHANYCLQERTVKSQNSFPKILRFFSVRFECENTVFPYKRRSITYKTNWTWTVPTVQIYFPKKLYRRRRILFCQQQTSKSEGSSENFISSHLIGKSTVMR